MNRLVGDAQNADTASSRTDGVSYAHPLKYPYYKRIFVLPGKRRDTTGYLTYGLVPGSPSKRVLLMVDGLADPVSESDRDEYRAFTTELDSNDSLGSIAKAKSFVVRLRTDPAVSLRFPRATVAVQKLGPVPVFATGLTVKVELHGETVEAQVVSYHNPRPSRLSAVRNGIAHSEESLLESLDHDLHVVFQRYYEDVAAQLLDIANHASLSRALHWAKECESIIGQSLNSKLKLVAPDSNPTRPRGGLTEWEWWGTPSNPLSSLQLKRKEFFERHGDQIFAAAYVRNTFLYLINQLYAWAGIASRRDEYFTRFAQIEERFGKYFGSDFVERAQSSIPQLFELQQYVRAYVARDEDALYLRQPQVLSTPWVGNTIQFMRLLHWLREYPAPSQLPRLFLSHQTDVSDSTTLKKQIEAHIEQSYKDRLLSFAVTGNEDSPRFRERIKFLIWQSDRLSCIAPLTPKKTGSEEVKDYAWLAREAEHSVHLGKPVVFLCEEGLAKDEFLRRMTKLPMDFLVPPVGNGEERERINDFTDQCRNQVQATYKLGGEDASAQKLDGRIVERLETEHRKMIASRHESLVLGFLGQFPLATRELLLAIHPLARSPDRMSKARLAVALVQRQFRDCEHTAPMSLKEVENAIATAWAHAGPRSLAIGHKSYRAFTLDKRNTYSLEINCILNALNTAHSPDEIKVIEERLLKQACITSNRS